MLKNVFRVSSIFACLASAEIAWAEDGAHPLIADRVFVQAGAYLPSKKLKLTVEGSIQGDGREFDFEKVTGGSDNDEVFELELAWRFGEKWSLRAQHYAVDSSRKAVLGSDITWRDETILAGSSVAAGSEFSVSRVFFGRTLDSRDNIDAGLGIGLHWLEIGAFIRPDIIIASADVSAAQVSGPLPNAGGWYFWSPSGKWAFGGRLDWFEASIGKFAGGITNVSAGANYQLFKNVGVGLNYQMFDLDVDVDSDKWHGRTEISYRGPFIYFSGNW